MTFFTHFNLTNLLYPSAVGLSIFGLQSIYNCAVRHIAKPFLSSYSDCMTESFQKNLSQRVEDTLLKMMTYGIAICTMMEGRTLIPVLVTTPIDYRQAFMGLIMCLAIKNQYNRIIRALHCKLTVHHQQTVYGDGTARESDDDSTNPQREKNTRSSNINLNHYQSNRHRRPMQAHRPEESHCSMVRHCAHTLWLLDVDGLIHRDRLKSQAHTL